LFIAGADMAKAKRLEGINKPEVLPKDFTAIIDAIGLLLNRQYGSDSNPYSFMFTNNV
jgi:hypothetical protein